jgi:hypothetical protein
MVLQDRGRFLLVVATPDMKLTRLGLRTKECCHEHADEIFMIYPASCSPLTQHSLRHVRKSTS